jgi:ferredoxin
MKIPSDPFLEKRLAAYDKWLEKGEISFSSKVIPVAESFSPEQWVLPSEQALEIVRRAGSIAVHRCICRSHYKRCDHPVEVCLLLNQVADKAVAREGARHVSPDEAAGILRVANESGLVHLSLYMPDHEVFALCSCCSCCCHDLQIVKRYGRQDLMVRSEYRASTRQEACILCGDCVDRCPFDARRISEERLVFSPDRCLGCGLCVATCPTGAVTMETADPP